VEEVGADVTTLAPGDRVVVPFNVSCGTCWTCSRNLHSQCETTQNRDQGTGASLFGYSKLYGQVPGGQAEYLRVPFGDHLPIKVPEGPPDDRFLFLSDVVPTAWQGFKYADVSEGDTLLVVGAGPIGDMVSRMAIDQGVNVITVDRVPERLARVHGAGADTIDLEQLDKDTTVADVVRDKTQGRGADAVVEAVGMEAHGSTAGDLVHRLTPFMPDVLAQPILKKAGVDRLPALLTAFDAVRRGGTVSISGVYGGAVDPLPLFQLFDKQVQIRMGQANVRAWSDELLARLSEENAWGVESFATHHLPLSDAPDAYKRFQEKSDGYVKVVFQP
jgi:threonine dehydrogenase-like Zn-dependent dehydrogenase